MSYTRAPITEAILDIQTEPLGCELAQLRAMGEATTEYPDIRDLMTDEFRFKIEGETEPVPVATRTQTNLGFQFWTIDKTRVWQARLNGFSLSHLKPYDRWEALIEDAKPLWARFRSVTDAVPTRMAVRYINRFDIPSVGKVNFADYFRTVPNIPSEIDTGLKGYLMQLILPQEDLKATAVITQTPTRPPEQGFASIIFDIDLFREGEIPQKNEDMWALFEQFRARKNFLFEMSIHESARELIR